MKIISYKDAIKEAIQEEMENDPTVFVIGGETKMFKFDQGAIFDDDEKNSAEAKLMNDWMRERAVKQSSAKTLQGAFAKTKTEEEIKQETVKNLNYYDQVLAHIYY